jgi:hypothetical protein
MHACNRAGWTLYFVGYFWLAEARSGWFHPLKPFLTPMLVVTRFSVLPFHVLRTKPATTLMTGITELLAFEDELGQGSSQLELDTQKRVCATLSLIVDTTRAPNPLPNFLGPLAPPGVTLHIAEMLRNLERKGQPCSAVHRGLNGCSAVAIKRLKRRRC